MSAAADDVKSIFGQALERPDPVSRAAYLAEACGENASLRAEVEGLLAAMERAGDFLNRAPNPTDATQTFGNPAATGTYRPAPTAEEAEGTIIAGRYKLRQQIGEGGMGTVWMADQTEPVKRKVAVKLIRVERGQSKTILARFDAERQAIALMDHPHIAKLLDAGTTDIGAPYFVMELVKGVPLTEYCDTHKLSIPERLNLFQQICSAVQHAHQKGIIHRDLKPTNILVESHDGKPVPKVIDFGLAKATTGLQLSEQSMFTAFGSVMGTPLYMAPEQATFNAVDVDTRADVYALGVILYEMLTGTTPLTKETMKKAAIDEMLKLIREQEAPTPSSRLSSADSLPSVSANRQTEPQKLGRFVKGELDWIVLKALSKDRDRRYETANGFARDIERFLNHEPVSAGPPSARYRLQKFVRRNRPQVIAASLVLFALLAGIAGTTIGLFEAKKQEQFAVASADKERKAKQEAEDEKANALKAAEAEKVAKLDADAKRQEAERNLGFARKGNSILGSVFIALDPQARYATVADLRNALRDNLVRAVKELDGSAIGDPLAVADMQSTLGVSLLGLGEAKLAIGVLKKALATRTALLGPENPDTLRATSNLAGGYLTAGQPDQAVLLLEPIVPLMKVKFGPDDRITLRGMNMLANGYQYTGRSDKAVPLLEETLALTRARYGPNDPDTLLGMNNLATGYDISGRSNEAIPLWVKTLELMKAKLVPDHPHTLRTMNNLAAGYHYAKRPDKAIPLWEELLERSKFKLGLDHPDTIEWIHNLASGHFDAGQPDKALPLFEQAYKLRKTKLGVDDRDTLHSMAGLAETYVVVGQLDKGLTLYEEVLPLRKAKLGADDPDTLATMWKLAIHYHTTSQPEKALPHFEGVYKSRKAKLGADAPDTLDSMRDLGACYWTLRRLDKSVPLFEELLSIHQKKSGRNDPDTQRTLANLGVNYKDAGRVAEAIPLLEEAYQASKKLPALRFVGTQLLDAYAKAGKPAEAHKLIDELLADARKSLPKDSPQLAQLLAPFGLTLLEMKGFAEAEPLLRECLVIREKSQPDVWSTFNTQSMLGGALLGQKKYADAEPLLVKGYEGLKAREKAIPPQADTRIPQALDRLVELYTATDKPDEAKKYKELRAKYPTPKEVAPMPKEKK